MLLMDYPSIIGGGVPDYAKNSHMEPFARIYNAHSQIIIDEYPVNGVQDLTIYQPQCAKMTFTGKSVYNRLFQQVIHIGGESEIKH